jgi:hypothetical protein
VAPLLLRYGNGRCCRGWGCRRRVNGHEPLESHCSRDGQWLGDGERPTCPYARTSSRIRVRKIASISSGRMRPTDCLPIGGVGHIWFKTAQRRRRGEAWGLYPVLILPGGRGHHPLRGLISAPAGVDFGVGGEGGDAAEGVV